MSKYSFSKFNIGLDALGISLSSVQREQFSDFFDILIEWNKVMNLTGITEWEDVVNKHFLDSLGIVKTPINMTQVSYLIDVGTGAGFPGIPLKIAFPDIKITLLDSLNKRINFLDNVISSLSLKDIETVHGRAEDLGKNDSYRQRYDLCVSRAVANMSSLSELCLPFVNLGGYFVSYKSDKADEEIANSNAAFSVLGGELESSISYNLDNDTKRIFYLIKKVKDTPSKFPRKAGVPLKDPIH